MRVGPGPDLQLVVVVAVARGVVLDGLLDQLRQARAALDQLIVDEPQLGAVANAERAAERAPQYRRSSLENLLRLLWLRAEHREEHLRVAQVLRHTHFRERDHAEARIAHFAPDQLAQRLLDLLCDSPAAGERLVGHATVLATSTRE